MPWHRRRGRLGRRLPAMRLARAPERARLDRPDRAGDAVHCGRPGCLAAGGLVVAADGWHRLVVVTAVADLVACSRRRAVDLDGGLVPAVTVGFGPEVGDRSVDQLVSARRRWRGRRRPGTAPGRPWRRWRTCGSRSGTGPARRS